MVGRGVNEDATLIPGSALYSDVFMNVAQALQLTVADHYGYRKEEKKKQYSSSKQVLVPSCVDSCHAVTMSVCCM